MLFLRLCFRLTRLGTLFYVFLLRLRCVVDVGNAEKYLDLLIAVLALESNLVCACLVLDSPDAIRCECFQKVWLCGLVRIVLLVL